MSVLLEQLLTPVILALLERGSLWLIPVLLDTQVQVEKRILRFQLLILSISLAMDLEVQFMLQDIQQDLKELIRLQLHLPHIQVDTEQLIQDMLRIQYMVTAIQAVFQLLATNLLMAQDMVLNLQHQELILLLDTKPTDIPWKKVLNIKSLYMQNKSL